MRRLSGQAVRGLGILLHRLASLCIGLAVLGSTLAVMAAWRLSQGPVDMSWLNPRIEAAVNADDSPTRLTIGSTALAWEGFRKGVDHPIDLRLSSIRVTTGARTSVELPRAEISLSIGALLFGRVIPREVTLDDARLSITRAADGTVSLNLGALSESTEQAVGAPDEASLPTLLPTLIEQLARPAGGDAAGPHGILSQLRRLRLRNAAVSVIDHQLGTEWRAPQVDCDIVRGLHGGIEGTATAALALGDQSTALRVTATMVPGGAQSTVRAHLAEVAPASLARAAPGLAMLDALDAPLTLDIALSLDRDLMPLSGRVSAHIGAGTVRVAAGQLPIEGADLALSGSPDEVSLGTGRLRLLGHSGGPETIVTLGGTARRSAGKLEATLTLGMDQVAFADLPRLWPVGVGKGARGWITENITSGTARDARFSFELAASADMSGLTVTAASGSLVGDDLTVQWLKPVPPMDQGQAEMRLLDPDTIEVVVKSARQRVNDREIGLPVRGGTVRFTGIAEKDQFAEIQADASGGIANIVTLLRHPRLELLDRHPIDLREPSGDATVALSVKLPLEYKVTMDDVAIHAVARLAQVHLSGFVAGRDLDQGALDLDATNDGLTIKGKARLAGIDAQLDGAMDFRPTAIAAQKVTVTAKPSIGQLTAAGIDLGDTVFGTFPMRAVLTERRNGEGEVAFEADLTPAALAVRPIGWRKPNDVAAKGSGRVLYDKGKLLGIDRIAVDGEGVSLRAQADCTDGHVTGLRIDRAALGLSDLRGSIAFPAKGPIAVVLNGPVLDMAAKLTAKPARTPKPRAEPPPGPAWTLDAQLDRVLLAHDKMATGVTARISNDGRITRALSARGTIGATGTFSASIDARRHLSVRAQDAGGFLRGFDLVRSIDGGKLSLDGNFDDTVPEHPLTGSAEITDFRVRDAPAFGKLLQAMTLYGMVDVLRGPGIGFTRLVAPLRYDDDGLELTEARAFSPSLGLTAKGRIDLAGESVDMQGTIVPAYFFNSLLGNLPIIGRLFSPETGGGLFAARYSIRGPLDDPTVFVNPLSALTPGFLREVFGLF